MSGGGRAEGRSRGRRRCITASGWRSDARPRTHKASHDYTRGTCPPARPPARQRCTSHPLLGRYVWLEYRRRERLSRPPSRLTECGQNENIFKHDPRRPKPSLRHCLCTKRTPLTKCCNSPASLPRIPLHSLLSFQQMSVRGSAGRRGQGMRRDSTGRQDGGSAVDWLVGPVTADCRGGQSWLAL